jgi:transposase-like protein
LCNGKIKLSYRDENLKQLTLINIERKRIQNAEAYFDFEIKQLHKISDSKLIDPLLLKFIRFAKKRLYNYRGTAKKNLILKFKEVEFRFNNSEVDIYDCLGKQISQNYKSG